MNVSGMFPFRHLFAATLATLVATTATGEPWTRHIVDDSARGADGVRLADINFDGYDDIATGWEESGEVRVYLHPGEEKVRGRWPNVTVGPGRSVEDAVFTDLDVDSAIDVVSCCEGKERGVFVHWAAQEPGLELSPSAWETELFPATRGVQWMFALPVQIDNQHGPDLILGAKGKGASVGWLQAPENGRDLDAWVYHKLYDAGWIMSLQSVDLDGDGDDDLIVSDRKGATSGVFWLENPGAKKATQAWPEHRVGAGGEEVMFLHCTDLDGDDHPDIAVGVKPYEIRIFKHPGDLSQPWAETRIPVVFPEGTGRAKAVRAGDLDRDGKPDLVFTCEGADPPKRGVVWLRNPGSLSGNWMAYDVAGPEGVKFDRIELLDLDWDGDLDILTCEERHKGKGLGVIWYENPKSP